MRFYSSAPTFDVELIDVGHERLFALEKRLLSFCKKGCPTCATCVPSCQCECDKSFCELFEELFEAMWEHFREEESLMTCLPEEPAQAHKYEHAELSKRLASLAVCAPNVVGPAKWLKA